MPYNIKQVGNKFSVVNSDTGKVMGTHPSKAKAQAQLGALYANVPDAKTEKLLLTGGDGFSIEYNTPDCQGGWCIVKNGTAQTMGCYKTEEEARTALEGLDNGEINILGDESRAAQTPEEVRDKMNKCLTCGCGDPTDDHNHDKPTMDSIWAGVFIPANKGFFDPGFNSTEQDARYYYPAKATYENDGKPSAGYGNRSSNQSIPTGEYTPDRTTRPNKG